MANQDVEQTHPDGSEAHTGDGRQADENSVEAMRTADRGEAGASREKPEEEGNEQQDRSNAKGKHEKSKTKPALYALQIGFFAGLIWGGLRIVEYYFRFTKVHPTFLIKPWSTPDFNRTAWGYMTGWAAFIVFSIVAAVLYSLFLRKIKGPWMGMLYGLIWFVLLHLVIGPPLGMMKPLGTIDWNSLIADGCLYLLWGLFIGYTIEFTFNDEQKREPTVSFA
ncbi:YqhR family membrane protein [Paenibacillus koleovorans]|uniref:YqhR family membrane protein n=1 Tax=Paenibacillus koleovorans TaxID=121608 RepID=UPI001FE2E98F|nr:YqhR family membrane protein [Paenibacillus koleovorans]